MDSYARAPSTIDYETSGRPRSLSASSAASARSSARRCGFPECMKTAKPGGLCISHGGGKKCSVVGCTTSVVSRGFCVAHGGGKRCQRDGCTKSAQTGGFCWIHGGGKKCGHDGCTKRAQSGGTCISHGGGKRCRIDNCNKVVQYEGLCVGHGGYRKCLSMNCLKKALPNGYCHGHGGHAKCHFGECPRKAVHGGFCGQHRTLGSPQQGVQSRSVTDSPVLQRAMRQHDVASISPLMPLPSSSTLPPPDRDWSRAIAEAKNSTVVRLQNAHSLPRPIVSSPLGGCCTPPAVPCRLPTVVELQRTCSLERAVGPLQNLPRLALDRIAPLLSAVESVQAQSSPITPIKREPTEDNTSSSSQTCCVATCGRFAKVDGVCLLHLYRRPERRPHAKSESVHAPIVQAVESLQ